MGLEIEKAAWIRSREQAKDTMNVKQLSAEEGKVQLRPLSLSLGPDCRDPNFTPPVMRAALKR